MQLMFIYILFFLRSCMPVFTETASMKAGVLSMFSRPKPRQSSYVSLLLDTLNFLPSHANWILIDKTADKYNSYIA